MDLFIYYNKVGYLSVGSLLFFKKRSLINSMITFISSSAHQFDGNFLSKSLLIHGTFIFQESHQSYGDFLLRNPPIWWHFLLRSPPIWWQFSFKTYQFDDISVLIQAHQSGSIFLLKLKPINLMTVSFQMIFLFQREVHHLDRLFFSNLAS